MRYYNSGELINSEIKKATIILNNKKSNFYYIKKIKTPKQPNNTTSSLHYSLVEHSYISNSLSATARDIVAFQFVPRIFLTSSSAII